ncbi:hypothetical protein FB45DRAFT_1018157 [Roridomyces roridus]|uniref:Uncharacterized protein n=1 Tax=Roridomyces roridus TaxID=1738132 RepID=A0AAD7G1J6_9AGAR|nr:hypothetical protein FB45DRAFT_1018157 [Roridomyces roridus]
MPDLVTSNAPVHVNGLLKGGENRVPANKLNVRTSNGPWEAFIQLGESPDSGHVGKTPK